MSSTGNRSNEKQLVRNQALRATDVRLHETRLPAIGYYIECSRLFIKRLTC